MRILDENGNEVLNPDWSVGYVTPDKIFIAHHEAHGYIPEQSHYEVIAEYPNGGKDIVKVIDVPEQQACDDWDEYEDILRYHLFDPELLLSEINIPNGTYFMIGAVLYKTTTTIPQWTAIIPNVNCIETSVEEALNQQEENNEKTDL